MSTSNLIDLGGAIGGLDSQHSVRPPLGETGVPVQEGTHGLGRARMNATPPPQYDRDTQHEGDIPREGEGDIVQNRELTHQRTARVTVGADTRDRVNNTNPFPYRALCHLLVTYTGGAGTATGFLVDPGLVATAAHVLWHPQLGKAETVEVVPARRQETFGTSQIAHRQDGRLQICNSWRPGAFKPWFDYAGVVLSDRQVFQHFGVLDFTVLSNSQVESLISDQYFCGVAGYPTETHGNPAPVGSMWQGKGRLSERGDRTLRHLVDTSPGQSGAPLYIFDSGRYWVVGIHSKEAESVDSNVVRRVTEGLVADIERWKALGLTSS